MATPDSSVGADALIQSLKVIVGDAAVLTAESDLEPYVTEWRGIERGHCIAAVRPATTAEVSQVMALCHARGVPVTPQGGNTGLVAGAVPHGGIVLATDRMNRIRGLDADNATMTVEAGCVLANAQAAAHAAGMVFPLSLAAEGSCHIGGNLSTNAGGNNTVRYGNTRENVLGLEVVLPDGRIWDGMRALRKNNTGYDLKHLFIGAEGTLGIITAAVFRLIPAPASRETILAACPDVQSVVDLFQRLRKAVGDQIMAYEMMPDDGVRLAEEHIPGVTCPFDERHPYYALIEISSPAGIHGLRDGLEECLGEALAAGLVADAILAENAGQANTLWKIREGIPAAQSMAGAVIKHDVSVPISAIPRFLEEGTRLMLSHVPNGRVVAFGHIGDGNIHFNMIQPSDMSRAAFLALTEPVNLAMHTLTCRLEGSFSAEHGIGTLKTGDMRHFRSEIELELMRAVKQAIDPTGIMNFGKVLP